MEPSMSFDSDKPMYKLMKYLCRVEEHMDQTPLVWVAIDIIQVLTIVISLLGEVIKTQYSIEGSGLFNNFLNIFFNYNTIYNWLVISGAASGIAIILGLVIYLLIEYRKQVADNTKNEVLKYCALTGTLSIGLFEFFFQVMANNIVNTIRGILGKTISMDVDIIVFFLLNVAMMVFVSIFNSEKRIFRFCLGLISLGLNILPFTATCIMIIGLSLYYQQMEKIIYKKLLYFIIILTCVWSAFQMNDYQTGYFLGSRFIYYGVACVALAAYFIHFETNFMNDSTIVQNRYLVELYKKKLRKQDKKKDYLLADQYFTMYYEKQTDSIIGENQRKNSSDSHLFESVQKWEEMEIKEKLIEKIKRDRRENKNTVSAKGDICYFEFLVQLKVNMVSLLREVFQFMYEKKNDNIQIIYQINKLTHRIKKQFDQQTPSTQDQVLKVETITNLEQLYQQFYTKYATIVQLLQDIFDSLQKHNGEIIETTEYKLANFTQQQKVLKKTLDEIQTVAPNKLETKLYKILSQLWDNYQNNSQTWSLKMQQKHANLPQSAQKFVFSYVFVSNQTIKYASIKFLSTYSYKQSYIIGENISMIFPSKFSQFILELLQKNAERKIFHSQVPILNQKGIFQIVNATFYLLPQFKGEITYIILFKKISQLETKSLFLFNSGTLCIQGFNKRIIGRFKFSLEKITLALQKGAIQLSNLFVFNSDDKDIFTSTQKNEKDKSKISRKSAENRPHYRQHERSSTMKATMKMDYLSDLKKTMGKSVSLEAQISFEINNISYKVIKVEDASSEKFIQSSIPLERTEEIKILRDQSGKSGQLDKSTKDLKRKYENEKFFCPIPNPYLPKILQKLNSFEQSGRLSNFMLIRIFFTVSLIFFIGGMVGLAIESSNFETSIMQFEKQAESLNRQYSYFMQGFLHVYSIYHMTVFQSQFLQYIQTQYGMNTQDATAFYNNQLKYLYADKKLIIQKYQDAYFEVPIVFDNVESVNVTIFTDFFTLTGSSKTTLYYDIVVFMLDSQNPILEKVITQNFHLFSIMIKILRPDGRYDSKIDALQQAPILLLLVLTIILVVFCVFIYFWLYQLRDTRQEIMLIYLLIGKKQIANAKHKVNQIQDMIQVLTNNKKTPSEQVSQAESRPTTLSEINSVHNLGSGNKKHKGSLRSFDDQTHEIENENEKLLNNLQDENETSKTSAKWNIITTSKGFSIIIETLLKYPFYFVLLMINIGFLLYAYFSMNEKYSSYVQAFAYFQKVRAQNFDFRYLYAKSQQYAYFGSVRNTTYVDSDPITISDKKTQFSYEKPDGFIFSIDENLCSQTNLANLTDPWFTGYNCTQIDGHILTRQFSQANEQYQRNLRQITNATYSQLITDPILTETYFNTMYEYQIFRNYFNQLSEINFPLNIDNMGAQDKQNFSYLFYLVILWIFLMMFLGFAFTFPKLETEISTIISLLKLIPSETLLNMKVASLIKKRNLLSKLSRL